MPLLFPTQGTLSDAFSPKLPFGQVESSSQSNNASSNTPPSDRYSVWSPIEDLKTKASTLSEEAATELKRSSEAVQARTGQIELHSAKYYATCTLGGLLACVGCQ
jgi:solute carrier family 25 (mitochondrial phosphate transporter), member 3